MKHPALVLTLHKNQFQMGRTVNEDIKELKYVGKYFSNLGGEEVSLNISCKQETRPTKSLAAKVEIYTVREATDTAKDIMVLERYFVNFSLTCKRKYPYYTESNEENRNVPKENTEGHTERAGWVVSIKVDRDRSSLKPQEWNHIKAGRSFQHTA